MKKQNRYRFDAKKIKSCIDESKFSLHELAECLCDKNASSKEIKTTVVRLSSLCLGKNSSCELDFLQKLETFFNLPPGVIALEKVSKREVGRTKIKIRKSREEVISTIDKILLKSTKNITVSKNFLEKIRSILQN